LTCTLASAQTPQARQPMDLRADRDPVMQQALEGAVHELGLQSSLAQHRLSVALVDVTDNNAPRLAMLNGDEMMYAASMPKIGILVGALAEAETTKSGAWAA
jgi:beta-lactamase class A